jgi:flagellar biosynthesis protein FliR
MMSFPLNIGLGFVVLGITVKVFFHILASSFSSLSQQITTLLRLLGA